MIGRRGESDDGTGASSAPILAALAIAVLLLVGIGVAALIRGANETDEDRVMRAVIGQNDALQRKDFADFTDYTCAARAGTQADLLARQQDSAQAHGARFVDGMTGLSVDGDRATATVTYHFENDPDRRIDTAMTFAREDGQWKVCSDGPQ